MAIKSTIEKLKARISVLEKDRQRKVDEQTMPYNKSGIDIKSVENLKTQSDTYEIHNIEVSGDASTGALLEVTTESDFQYSICIGDYVCCITESENVYWGRVDSFDEKILVLQSEEIGIATSIPYSVITHINSRWRARIFEGDFPKSRKITLFPFCCIYFVHFCLLTFLFSFFRSSRINALIYPILEST